MSLTKAQLAYTDSNVGNRIISDKTRLHVMSVHFQ